MRKTYLAVLLLAGVLSACGARGSYVMRHIANAGDFVQFYYQLTEPDSSIDASREPEHIGFAITGENIRLACGIHTGMSVEDAVDIVPGLYHFRWDQTDRTNALT